MTTLSPPPIRENVFHLTEPPSRWRRLVPRSRRGKTALAGGLAVVFVAGVLGATYETSPGGTLWGAEKAIFPEHSQDVALAAVVDDLKQAQDILGSGQQPTPDQLTSARNSLNQAKQDLDYVSSSAERTNLQNLYLQLTQQLLQYTPDSTQQLAALPVPLPAVQPPDAGGATQTPDVALMNATAPSWGYPITDESGTLAAPPGVPDAPAGDWPQPYEPPLTPNLQDLGYFDPSWGQLYGYDPTDWYNYDLSGYNQYGYDFLGFDRWGYDRWGYDRWGYDHQGYNWGGYNWAGYDRNGWDRDGRNDWGQRRDHPADPRDQNWYNGHHPYEQYYQWKFQNDDPVYRRTQWDQAHGFNPNQYQNWNMNRDWHNPRNRDWAPLPTTTTTAVTDVNVQVSAPVVNLNTSLAQFVSTERVTTPGPSVKDLADKSTRDFSKELAPRGVSSTGPQPPSPLGQQPANTSARNQTRSAPPALTEPAPSAPPSRVAAGFVTPQLSPVPVDMPHKANQPPAKAGMPARETEPTSDPSLATMPNPSKADSPRHAVTSPPEPISPAPGPDDSPGSQANSVPPESESPQDHRTAPAQHDPVQQSAAPEPPAHDEPAPRAQDPAPKVQAPAPTVDAPAPKAATPAPEAPAPEAPARQAPVRQAPAPQVPPPHEAPPPTPPEQHAPAAPAGKCSIPMCG